MRKYKINTDKKPMLNGVVSAVGELPKKMVVTSVKRINKQVQRKHLVMKKKGGKEVQEIEVHTELQPVIEIIINEAFRVVATPRAVTAFQGPENYAFGNVDTWEKI